MSSDPRLQILPDNDHRWTYQVLLGLEKQGALDGQDVRMFFYQCHVSCDNFPKVLEKLMEVGLLCDNYRPIGFDEWQKAALRASRNKRHRDSETQARRTGDAGETQVSPSYTDTDTDTDKKEDTSGKPADVSGKQNIKKMAREVLDHIVSITGRKFTNTYSIEACLKREGCSVVDCRRMLDFKMDEWRGKDMETHIDPVTPFRPSKFRGYMDQTNAGPVRTNEESKKKTFAQKMEEELEREATEQGW